MAEADLDVVIRLLAKRQNKDLMAAAKSRRDRYIGLAAKAKNKEARTNTGRSPRIPCCRALPREAAADFRRQRRRQLRQIDAAGRGGRSGQQAGEEDGGEEDKGLIRPHRIRRILLPRRLLSDLWIDRHRVLQQGWR